MNTVNTPNGIFYIDVEDCWIRNHMSSGKVYEHHIINGMLKQYIEKSKYLVPISKYGHLSHKKNYIIFLRKTYKLINITIELLYIKMV